MMAEWRWLKVPRVEVLAGEADRVALGQQRAEGERLGGRPVDAVAGLDHLRAWRRACAARSCAGVKPSGSRVSAAPTFFRRRHLDRGLAALVAAVAAAEARPAAVEPVGLVRAVVLAGLELGVEVRLEGGLHVLDLALGDQAVGDEAVGVELQRGLVALDRGVHQRLGEHRLVALVVAEPAVAEDVDDDVLVEALAELDRDAGGVDHGLGVVAVDVEDRRLDHQRDVGRVGRGARVHRRGGEADLVVDDDVDGAAGPVALEARRGRSIRRRRPGRRRPRRRGAGSAAPWCARCRCAAPAWRGPCRARPGRPPRGGEGLAVSDEVDACCRRTRGPRRRRGGT